jgi:tetratricopeptide (TPR) repeat protein
MPDSPRIEELKRRVESDPASIAFAALAEEYRRAGRFDDAISTCRHGLQRHPSYISAHVTLGRALLEMSHFEEAKLELEHVLRVAPENLAAIRGLAEIHHRHGESKRSAAFSASHFEEMTAAAASAPAAAEDANRDEPEPPPAERPPNPPRIPVYIEARADSVLPPVDPALAPLEAFLEAILRARGSGQGVHLS